MSLTIHSVAPGDDLAAICAQMTAKAWGADNEMTDYDADELRRYLASGTNLLLLAYSGEKIAGVAVAREHLHPAGDHTLYVDELDTHPDLRRQGIATALMHELFAIARARGLKELWVGTEQDNHPADAFYRSLRLKEV